jgi:hypothetical protein
MSLRNREGHSTSDLPLVRTFGDADRGHVGHEECDSVD